MTTRRNFEIRSTKVQSNARRNRMTDKMIASRCPVPNGLVRRRAVCLNRGTRRILLVTFALGLWIVPDGDVVLAQSTTEKHMESSSKCPMMGKQAGPNRHTAAGAMSIRDWWPNPIPFGTAIASQMIAACQAHGGSLQAVSVSLRPRGRVTIGRSINRRSPESATGRG